MSEAADAWISLHDYLEEKGILHNPVPECEICGGEIAPNPEVDGFEPYLVRVDHDSNSDILNYFLDSIKMVATGRNRQKDRYEYVHEKCLKSDLEMKDSEGGSDR